MNHLNPFTLTIQPLIQDIVDKEIIVESLATVGIIKGLSVISYSLIIKVRSSNI